MSDNTDYKFAKILEYNRQTGLIAHNKAEIYEDLKQLTRVAYGNDYVIEQGAEWWTFLDLLAGSLAQMGGASQALYNSLSFQDASGVNLDKVVSYAGIRRKSKTNSTVKVVITLTEPSTMRGNMATYPNTIRPCRIDPRTVIVSDNKGNKWINKEQIYISRYKVGVSGSYDTEQENFTGTALFEAYAAAGKDETNVQLAPYNNGSNKNFVIDESSAGINSGEAKFSFINEVYSTLGSAEETDAQLRYRYATEIYKDSVGTIEGLRSKILELSHVNYVKIYENSSSNFTDLSNNNKLAPHSIWVIVDGKSTWDGNNDSKDVADIDIAERIFLYKSLGCSTSWNNCTKDSAGNIIQTKDYNNSLKQGTILVKLTDGSEKYEIRFSRAKANKFSITVKLFNSSSFMDKTPAEKQIKENIKRYVEGLTIGDDVLYSGIVSQVYKVISDNKYSDYVFDLESITIGTAAVGKKLSIKADEFPVLENVNIIWTDAQ